jgi:hypothetical protein
MDRPPDKEIQAAAEWIVDSISTATQLDISNEEHGIRDTSIENVKKGIMMLYYRRFADGSGK